MAPEFSRSGARYRAYTSKHLDELTARAGLDAGERLAVKAVALRDELVREGLTCTR